ncbi:hypothetical protein [Clostridium thailandense]
MEKFLDGMNGSKFIIAITDVKKLIHTEKIIFSQVLMGTDSFSI